MFSAHVTPETIDVMAGSAQEVGKRLSRLGMDQVVAIGLQDMSAQEAGVIATTLGQVVQLVHRQLVLQERGVLESLVEALVPKSPPTPTQLKEAAMLARARTAVLQDGQWLTTARIAELAGFSASNPSAQPNKWKHKGQIFAIRHHGIDYFPGYGLDPEAGYRPYKAMAAVLAAFGESKDPWGLAYWFSSVNSFLGGQRPQDLLARQPDRVLAAAVDELEAVAHG